MKVIEPSYEILTPISEGGIDELKRIERIARVCYKSEDKITEDGESAKALISKLIAKGHDAMLEHSQLSVIFTVDRGVSHELVRHRLCSFAQESTRYCNYSKDKFDGEITVVEPVAYRDVSEDLKGEFWAADHEGNVVNRVLSDLELRNYNWYTICCIAEELYNNIINNGGSPQEARAVLPTSLKTEIVVTANYREWRHIFDLRCSEAAHPDMRYIMTKLRDELRTKIPIIFD